VRLLIDTHVQVRLLLDQRTSIPAVVADALEDTANDVLISAVSIWEIAIKRSANKLGLEDWWPAAVKAFGFAQTPVTAEHAIAVQDLPWHHKDPFDRLLVAQARVEGATLVTADRRLASYDVPILWG
jgi:PIN domain nuclease of toxin-antitoxin system